MSYARAPGRLPRTCGLTLVEVLVALTVLAVAGAALASVQLGALRTGRAAQVRVVAAEALAQELLHQRVASTPQAGPCAAAALAHEWECRVATSCPIAEHACALQRIEVTVSPPRGRELVGVTVRYQPLVEWP